MNDLDKKIDGLTFGETKKYAVQGKIKAYWSSIKKARTFMAERIGKIDTAHGRTVIGNEMKNGWLITYYGFDIVQ